MNWHWVVKIVVMIACVVGFGFVVVIIGIPALFIADATGGWGLAGGDFMQTDILKYLVLFMSVFGCIGAVLGGCVGYKIIRSKFK